MRLRFLAGALFVSLSVAQEPAHRPLELRSPVQDKNVYVLSLLERTPGAAKAVGEERPLASILDQKRASLERAATSCKTVSCIDGALRWTDTEIATGADALRQAYSASDAVHMFVDE